MGFTLCNHHKSIRLEIGLRGSKSIIQSRQEEGQKEVKKYKLLKFDLWIELDFDNNNNRVNFYQFKHYPDNKKSQWKKVASKEITMKEFQSDSSAREEIFDIIFGTINPCNMLIQLHSFLFNDCTILTKWQFCFYKLRYNDAKSVEQRICLRSFLSKVVSNLKFYQIFTKSSQSNR